jgi:hypothetical protein
MGKVVGLVLLLLSAVASAKPWKGITPGTTSKDEVLKKFGQPTKRVVQGEKLMLAYADDEAIKGTRQTEFLVDKGGTVIQIAVFPAGPVDKATIEESYGPDCAKANRTDCYVRKLSEEDYRTYYWFKGMGLVVFFNTDGTTVQSFLYVAPNSGGSSSAGGAASKPSKEEGPPPKAKPKKPKGDDTADDETTGG